MSFDVKFTETDQNFGGWLEENEQSFGTALEEVDRTFDASFGEKVKTFNAAFKSTTQTFDANFLTGDIYRGPYKVIPKTTGQTLPTKQKTMADDVSVYAIPYFEVSNTSGGSTVYIGGNDEIHIE